MLTIKMTIQNKQKKGRTLPLNGIPIQSIYIVSVSAYAMCLHAEEWKVQHLHTEPPPHEWCEILCFKHFSFNKRASNQLVWASVGCAGWGSIYDIIFYMTIFPLNYTNPPPRGLRCSVRDSNAAIVAVVIVIYAAILVSCLARVIK